MKYPYVLNSGHCPPYQYLLGNSFKPLVNFVSILTKTILGMIDQTNFNLKKHFQYLET